MVTDLSPQFGNIRDQGRRPTCLAFAASDLHASVRSVPFVPLSVEYLYYHACRLATPFDPHSGVTLDDALWTVEHDGQPEEAAWPYLPQLPNDLSTYQPPAITAPIYRRKGESLSGTVMDRIGNTLTANRPSMLIFRSSLNFVQALAHVPVFWSSSDTLLNLHAVLVVGLGKDGDARVVRVRNSWGAGWADSGHAWLREEYVENTFIDLVGMV